LNLFWGARATCAGASAGVRLAFDNIVRTRREIPRIVSNRALGFTFIRGLHILSCLWRFELIGPKLFGSNVVREIDVKTCKGEIVRRQRKL
jgi:hypothetical protein